MAIRASIDTQPIAKSSMIRSLLHQQPQQIDAAVRVAPLVVVPRQHLHEVAVHHLGVRRVDDRRVRVALEVDRHELFVGVGEDALERAVGRFLERGVDLFARSSSCRRSRRDRPPRRSASARASRSRRAGPSARAALRRPRVAAPVVVGIIDSAAARARRRSLCGRSSSF